MKRKRRPTGSKRPEAIRTAENLRPMIVSSRMALAIMAERGEVYYPGVSEILDEIRGMRKRLGSKSDRLLGPVVYR